MKYLIACLILFFGQLAFAEQDLVEHIQLRCNFLSEKIPLDVREDCMTDYLNCAVGLGGKIDLKRADDECLTRKGREREDDRIQDKSGT